MARTPKATATVKPPKPTPGSVLADALISYGDKLGQLCELLAANQNERREWHREAIGQTAGQITSYDAAGEQLNSAMRTRSWIENILRLATLAVLVAMLVHWW